MVGKTNKFCVFYATQEWKQNCKQFDGGGLRQTAQAFTLENEKRGLLFSGHPRSTKSFASPTNVPFLSLRTPEVLRQLSLPLDDILHLASPQNGA